MNQPRRGAAVLALVCLVLAVTAGVAVWPRFDGLYGQDSFAYYDYARGPLDRALRGAGPLPAFFWPPGFPLLMWLVMQVVGSTPRAGQVVALAAAAALPLLVALLAWELFVAPAPESARGAAPVTGPAEPRAAAPREPGLEWLPLLAGLLVATQGQLWQSSVVVMSDAPALAAGTAGVWLTARWDRTGRRSLLPLAAGLLSYAVLTRWAYALVALPITAFAVFRLLAMLRGGGRKARSGSRPERSRLAAGPVLQGLGALGVVLLVLSPMWLPAGVDVMGGKEVREVAFAGSFGVYDWNPLNAVRRTFSTTDGRLAYRLPNGLYYVMAPAHPYFFTPLLAAFLLPGAWQLWRRRTSGRLWLIGGWAGAVAVFHAGAPYQNFRFTLAYLPPLAVVAGVGILTVRTWSTRAAGRRRKVAEALLGGYVLVGLAAMAWGGLELTRFFIDRKDSDLATVAWVESLTPPESRLLAFNMAFTLERYGSRETEHLFYHTPGTVAALVAGERPTFLLLETDSFLTQWAGHRSVEAFRWLQEEPGLVEVGRDREYVLYRVGGGGDLAVLPGGRGEQVGVSDTPSQGRPRRPARTERIPRPQRPDH